MDDEIPALPIQAVHDATIYALFMYYSIVFEAVTPRHSWRSRKELLAAARQLEYEDLPSVTAIDYEVWLELLERLADAILFDRDFELEPYTADVPPEQAQAIHQFMGITSSYHAYFPPDPADPEPLLDRVEAYLKVPRK